MQLTPFEINVLEQVGNEFVKQVREAIKTKSISRARIKRLPGGGISMENFSAPVNNTGSLANSVRVDPIENGIQVLCNGYIDTLIYGRKPGTFPPNNPVESWLSSKGLSGFSSYAISNNMEKYGNSIWRVHKGQDSGLLADVDITMILEKAKRDIAQNKIADIANQLLTDFKIS